MLYNITKVGCTANVKDFPGYSGNGSNQDPYKGENSIALTAYWEISILT